MFFYPYRSFPYCFLTGRNWSNILLYVLFGISMCFCLQNINLQFFVCNKKPRYSDFFYLERNVSVRQTTSNKIQSSSLAQTKCGEKKPSEPKYISYII